MNITRRFIYLLLIGLFLLMFGILGISSLNIFILYNLICITLLLIDFFISPGEKQIEVSRSGEENLSLLEEEAIELELYNKSDYKLTVQLVDELPEFHFKCENKHMWGIVAPHEKKSFKYNVVPVKRGVFTFKAVHIKHEGRLKLCSKIIKVDLDREYKVYPNLKSLRKYRLSAVNNRQLKQGQRNLQMLGRGTSFESLREYIPGDEYRKINWKATARGNKPIVNQYEPEKNQHVYMFVDTGRPMSYTVRGNRKLDMVVNTALVLSDIVNQNGDQSGLMLFNTKVNAMLPPGKGAGHRNRILEALYHIEGTKETSNYDEAFYEFMRKERHRSIVFLFTDFETIEEAENMLKALPVLSRNNLVIIMLIRNETLEEVAEEKIRNQQELFDKGVALELLDERKRIIKLLNHKGIRCVECISEKLELDAINQYIRIKNRTYM